MIVNRSVKIGSNGGRIFILLFILTIALKSVISVSRKNSSNIENSNNCGGEYSGYQYIISSPKYPENYPQNQDCVYILRGSRLAKCEQLFNLQFLDFALSPSENCDQDYLEIGERSVYCGRVDGIRRYPGTNNSLTLRFHSASGRGGKGFKILVTTLPCAEVLEAGNAYPVHRPENDFTVEDNRQSERRDQSVSRIENLSKNNEKNIVTSARESFGVGPVNSFELPVRQSQLFRDSTTTKVAIVTPTPVKFQEAVSPKISAYLFVPSVPEQVSKKTETLAKYSSANVPKVFLKNDVHNFNTSPSSEFTLPSKRITAVFREGGVTNNTGKLQFIEDRQMANQKFIVPARSYGVPAIDYYPSVKVSESEIKTGEVLENSNENAVCEGKNNFEPDLEVTANFRESNPTLIDNIGSGGASGFQSNYYPATKYGAPELSPPTNVRFAPSPSYGPPAENYPDSSTGSGRPNTNFVPSSDFPTNPGTGTGTFYPGIGGGYSHCCKTEYSAQRFLLASPGFPSLLYSRNSYECIYSIRPYSSNICQIRFNFKFFNHGTEDRFCTCGHVEIDGQRICGCKRGLGIVSPVSTSFPKTIGVRYIGYPRTKFNGFLIEVVQEPCSNSYPYLSRNKKDVGNATHEIFGSNFERSFGITNSSSRRTKRNLGYSYPKPNFGLSEERGVSQSWNSGNSINTGIHQQLNQGGISGNLFAPISTCQALSFFDWVNAAKDVYLRGARCIVSGGSGNGTPGYPGNGGSGTIIPGYPGNGGSGTIIPGYPGNGGSGTIIPGYPGNGGSGTIIPGYPGNGGSGTIIPGYPGNGGSGTIIPGYPGNGGSGTIIPGYPGSGGSGTIIPGYPGSGGSGTIIPGYPGNGGSGTIIPGYPGNGGSGTIIPGYPGNGGSGTIIPGYPGNGGSGTIIPGYPGSGGSGTIIPGYPGSGGWNNPSFEYEDVNLIEGIISSPQYPTNYPNNVNKCFRFYKAPEYCQLEVVFLDFDLENSRGCSKDYIAFSGQKQRYCGNSLAGSRSLIDISRTNTVDMCFVSDGYGSGRGFSAGFSQFPCRGLNNR